MSMIPKRLLATAALGAALASTSVGETKAIPIPVTTANAPQGRAGADLLRAHGRSGWCAHVPARLRTRPGGHRVEAPRKAVRLGTLPPLRGGQEPEL